METNKKVSVSARCFSIAQESNFILFDNVPDLPDVEANLFALASQFGKTSKLLLLSASAENISNFTRTYLAEYCRFFDARTAKLNLNRWDFLSRPLKVSYAAEFEQVDDLRCKILDRKRDVETRIKQLNDKKINSQRNEIHIRKKSRWQNLGSSECPLFEHKSIAKNSNSTLQIELSGEVDYPIGHPKSCVNNEASIIREIFQDTTSFTPAIPIKAKPPPPTTPNLKVDFHLLKILTPELYHHQLSMTNPFRNLQLNVAFQENVTKFLTENTVQSFDRHHLQTICNLRNLIPTSIADLQIKPTHTLMSYLVPLLQHTITLTEYFTSPPGALLVILVETPHIAHKTESLAKILLQGIPYMKTALISSRLDPDIDTPIPRQIHRLSQTTPVVIATPGRLMRVLKIWARKSPLAPSAFLRSVAALVVSESVLKSDAAKNIIERVMSVEGKRKNILVTMIGWLGSKREKWIGKRLTNVFEELTTHFEICWLEKWNERLGRLGLILQDGGGVIVLVKSDLAAELILETILKKFGVEAFLWDGSIDLITLFRNNKIDLMVVSMENVSDNWKDAVSEKNK
ncbi:DEAD (Asp-Glu-Ala-Asp) box polypeptide 59, partial [Nowakowskiella sp. JEL0078]